MPHGEEEKARVYYGRLLGLVELEKPATLKNRGGVWFALPAGLQLHLGVEEPFRPQKKAHPAFQTEGLDALAARLAENGYPVQWDMALAPRRRFYSEDSFGNRLEYMNPLHIQEADSE
jgi:hypothetical protein